MSKHLPARSRHVAVAAWLFAALLWSPAAPTGAAEQVVTESRDVSLTVGVREWLSQGRSANNIAAPDGHPNVLSELTWRGVNSVVTEVSGDLVVNRIVASLSLGYGGITNGTFLDQDWNGDNRTQKEVETISTVGESSVFFVSVTPGVRLFHWTVEENPIRGGLDALIGYQLWRERYQAFGGQYTFPVNAPLPGGVAISQTNSWQSLRLGLRATVPVFSFLAVKGSVFYIPVTYYRSEDVHHLRPDLAQNPSFLTTASGGQGVQAEGAVVIRPWRQLLIEAGYQYWDIRSGQGTVQAFGADGSVAREPFNVDNTRRQGVFFGVSWLF